MKVGREWALIISSSTADWRSGGYIYCVSEKQTLNYTY
jgi:hypothetical protein